MSFNLDGLSYRMDGTPAVLMKLTSIGEDPVPYHATWGDLVVMALNSTQPGDRERSLDAITGRSRLAKRITRGGDITVKKETTLETIKECCKNVLAPDLVMQICDLIDPPEDGPESDAKHELA